MDINDRLAQLKAVVVAMAGFTKWHKRASITAAVVLLTAGPPLDGTGGQGLFLNPVSGTRQALVGFCIIALVVRRIMRANDRRQAVDAAGQLPAPLSQSSADGFNSTTGRQSMTTITLNIFSYTGRLEELADGLLAGIDMANAAAARLRWLYAEGLDIARCRVAEEKAAVLVPLGDHASLDAVAILGMGWPVASGRLRRSVRLFHDKAEPP